VARREGLFQEITGGEKKKFVGGGKRMTRVFSIKGKKRGG